MGAHPPPGRGDWHTKAWASLSSLFSLLFSLFSYSPKILQPQTAGSFHPNKTQRWNRYGKKVIYEGENWLVELSPDESLRKTWGQLDSTAFVEIFGAARATKHYRFWQEYNGALQWTNFKILAEGLGFIQVRGGDGGIDFDDVDLIGAIINGTTYGHPVSVHENSRHVAGIELSVISYPNPFASVAKIEVSAQGIAQQQSLQIIVYNLNGQEVRSIHFGIVNAGQIFRTIWNGHNDFKQRLPNGIYFIQVRLGSLVQTRRIVFLH